MMKKFPSKILFLAPKTNLQISSLNSTFLSYFLFMFQGFFFHFWFCFCDVFVIVKKCNLKRLFQKLALFVISFVLLPTELWNSTHLSISRLWCPISNLKFKPRHWGQNSGLEPKVLWILCPLTLTRSFEYRLTLLSLFNKKLWLTLLSIFHWWKSIRSLLTILEKDLACS